MLNCSKDVKSIFHPLNVKLLQLSNLFKRIFSLLIFKDREYNYFLEEPCGNHMEQQTNLFNPCILLIREI
jgi:hypothetical protein